MQAEAVVSALKIERGPIYLSPAPVQIQTPASFVYINRLHAERVLVDIWGNPPGTPTLGLFVPDGTDFLSNDAWGVVVQYLPDGHVSDDGFAAIDFDALLDEMRQATRMATLKRAQQGYRGLELIGWAEPPALDQNRHVLSWARELEDPADQSRIVNYNVRVLGRRGVLVLKAVAPIESLDNVRKGMTDLTASTSFRAGHRYAEFNQGEDPSAAYGIAGLVSESLRPEDARFVSLWVWGSLALASMIVISVLARRRQAKA